jgi:predicted small lipoprotein YifL
VHRRWLTVALVVCVLLAGCGSPGSPETPDDTQNTLDTTDATPTDARTTTATTEAPDATLRVESDSDRAVNVAVRVTERGGETYYETTETLTAGDQLFLDSVVADRTPVEVTVAVANDTATRELFVGEGLTFVVANASSLSVEKIWYSA